VRSKAVSCSGRSTLSAKQGVLPFELPGRQFERLSCTARLQDLHGETTRTSPVSPPTGIPGKEATGGLLHRDCCGCMRVCLLIQRKHEITLLCTVTRAWYTHQTPPTSAGARTISFAMHSVNGMRLVAVAVSSAT